MSATRYASVLDLGFGDSGKGLFVDALTRRWQAHTVVRFSGGAQAGHNVVTPSKKGEPARHHTFSQFGAGTFVPGTHTVLLDPFILHPTALIVEAEALARAGVQDALSRLLIDARCRVTTPFHQAAGRLRELLRGADPHGTCGVGVGETVRHSLGYPDQTIYYLDLLLPEACILEKLHALRETLLAEFTSALPATTTGELEVLQDETLALRWLRVARALVRQCAPTSICELRRQLRQPGAVLFEGAQGVLLDEWRGFHPHTTWSSITPIALKAALSSLDLSLHVNHYGVLRTYLTRHGKGPFPTHDSHLGSHLPEHHNQSDGWQGEFRRGHPDAVLMRYALEVTQELSGLAFSHMDVFDRGVSLKWCESYEVGGFNSAVENLPLGALGDLGHQSRLTRLLFEAVPRYADSTVTSEALLLDYVASITNVPVVLRSFGTTSDKVVGNL